MSKKREYILEMLFFSKKATIGLDTMNKIEKSRNV